MATLKQYLALGDGVSGPLNKMASAAARLNDRQEKVIADLERTEAAMNTVSAAGKSTALNLTAGQAKAVGSIKNAMDAVDALHFRMDEIGRLKPVVGNFSLAKNSAAALNDYKLTPQIEKPRYDYGINTAPVKVPFSYELDTAPAKGLEKRGFGIAYVDKITQAAKAADNYTRALGKARITGAAAGKETYLWQVKAANATGKSGKMFALAEEAAYRMGNIGGRALEKITTAGRSAAASIKSVASEASSAGGFLGKISQSMAGQFAIGNIVAGALMGTVEGVMAKISGLVNKSDMFSGMMARMELVAGSQEQAIALNERIYQSALRARGSYETMADSVSKIGLTAKEAFPNPREIVPFVENIQKLFAIGGTDKISQRNAMLQLTQALGSGRLQGDELRSIAEAAPMIEQVIAEYMGVSVGAIKQLGSEGKITSEIIKNAMLSATDEIDAKFTKIPLKWQDIWTNIATRSDKAFQPVYEQISALASLPIVQSLAGAFVSGATLAANAIGLVIDGIMLVGNIAAAVGGYVGSWLSAGFYILRDAAEAAAPFVIGTLAAISTAALMYGAYWVIANGALLAHIAVLGFYNGAVAICVAVMNEWRGVTTMMAAAQALLNFIIMANPLLLFVGLVAVVIGAFVAWQVHTMGLRNALAGAFGFIAEKAAVCVNFMIERINDLIDVLNSAAGLINKVFKTNIEAVAKIDYRADAGAWKKDAQDFVQDFSLQDIFNKMAGGAVMGPLEAIASNTAASADNTKGIKEAMDIMDEDLKFYRDMAEQEVINRYTTARVDIKVENQNNIASNVDADGMITHLIDQLGEAMAAGGEAVHA